MKSCEICVQNIMDLRISKYLLNPDLLCHSFLRIGDNCQVCVDSIYDELNTEEYYDIFFILQEI